MRIHQKSHPNQQNLRTRGVRFRRLYGLGPTEGWLKVGSWVGKVEWWSLSTKLLFVYTVIFYFVPW